MLGCCLYTLARVEYLFITEDGEDDPQCRHEYAKQKLDNCADLSDELRDLMNGPSIKTTPALA